MKRKYVRSLAIEIVLGLIEAFVQITTWAYPLKAAAISSVISGWNLWEVWRETPAEERPEKPIMNFMGLWFAGWFALWGIFVGVSKAQSTFFSSTEPPEFLPARIPVLPTHTPRPTYTPLPTYTPFPTPTSTWTPTPTPTPTFTPSPTPTPTLYVQVCQDAPPSPFAVGREGYICNRDNILIRTRPSLRAKVIGSLTPGTRFKVIGGPECGDRRVWWQVRLYIEDEGYTGMIGWMPETSPGGDEIYICPQRP